MCIAVIKKIKNSDYKYIIAFNRDEKVGKSFKLWGYFWDEYQDIYGCLDEETQGTWFAINDNNVVAFLLNREILDTTRENKSRGKIILNVLKNVKSAKEAKNKVNTLDLTDMRPFNLVILDCKSVYYLGFQKNNIYSYQMKQNLILLNRSYPNDFNEVRIRSNYSRFFELSNRDLFSCSWWNTWKEYLTDNCYCKSEEEERKMFLISTKWRTLSSTMVVLNIDRKRDIFKVIYGG